MGSEMCIRDREDGVERRVGVVVAAAAAAAATVVGGGGEQLGKVLEGHDLLVHAPRADVGQVRAERRARLFQILEK